MREPVARNAPNPDNAPGLGEDASFPSRVPSLPSSIRREILRQGGGSGRPQRSTNLDNSLTSIFFASQQCASSASCSRRFPDRPIGIASSGPRMVPRRMGDLRRRWHLSTPVTAPYDAYDRSTCGLQEGLQEAKFPRRVGSGLSVLLAHALKESDPPRRYLIQLSDNLACRSDVTCLGGTASRCARGRVCRRPGRGQSVLLVCADFPFLRARARPRGIIESDLQGI